MFITGVRGESDAKQIRVYEQGDPTPVWTWDPSDAEALMTDEERAECSAVLNSMREYEGITEIKWAAGGAKVAAIIGGAAVLIDYASKALLFGACNNTSMHSLEVLPDDRLAIVTSGPYENDGVWVYDTSTRIAEHPVQELPGLRSGHALVWDETERMLWAAGADVWPETSGKVHGRLVGYRYRGDAAEPLSYSKDRDYKMRESRQLRAEYPTWKEGPHDLTPVPGERKLLVVTDLDAYEFDLDALEFGYDVADTYFKGFATSPDRQEAGIPRSGFKSLSVAPTGVEYVYTANDWRTDFTTHVRFFTRDEQEPAEALNLKGLAYKARWFDETPGWPAAR
ncbi:DUF6528 family protein [Streptomyces sp. NRRL S-244]|uniref:DUF6528 family protein n=1 Tax=Streptomyces sp. NRRL S-244 TaxID=1463897 RepID=UPI0004C1B8F7|nr:DUF6528 family protein [Streptomyces sp. NRRL S-244]